MNPTASVNYTGELRTTAVHIRSQQTIITDAPTDNNGKGEAFSPTDLVATGLVSCMITDMSILANKNGIQIGAISGEVEKVMASEPRRITALVVELRFAHHNLSDIEKTLLENTAINCPVAKSIHPNIAVNVKFNYN